MHTGLTPREPVIYRATATAAVLLAAVGAGVVIAHLLPDPAGAAAGTPVGDPTLRMVARTARMVGATAALGALVTVTALLSSDPDVRQATRLMRVAAVGSVIWGVGSAAEPVGVLLAAAPRGASDLDLLRVLQFATTSWLGVAFLAQLALAAVAALCAFLGRSSTSAAAALVCVGMGISIGAASGHSSGNVLHGLASAAIVLHVVAAAVWVGTLAAVVAVVGGAENAAALMRGFRRLSLMCAFWVGISGLTAGALMTDVERLLDSRYGWLLLVKTAVFAAAVAMAWWASRRISAGPHPGSRRQIARFAVVELLLLAGTLGLAVVLSQSTPVLPDLASGASLVEDPPSVGTTIGALAPSGWGVLAVLATAGPYVAGMLILRRRGDRWPPQRAVLFLAGVVVLAVVSCTGIDAYASVLLSVHMLQHMTLNMVVPILLVLGAPVTLAFRALPRGPRAVLLSATRSRAARIIAHPVVVTVAFVGTLFAVYFTPLFPVLMSDHLGHAVMQLHFLLSGFLFFWLVLGIDPDRYRPAGPIRIPLIAASMVGHTVFSVVLVFGTSLIGSAWISEIDLPWPVDRVADQHLAGGIAWGLGEFVMVGVVGVLIYRWFAAAERADRGARGRRPQS